MRNTLCEIRTVPPSGFTYFRCATSAIRHLVFRRSRVSCTESTSASADKHVPLRQSCSKPQWTSQPPGCCATCFFRRIPGVPCEVRPATAD
ncbi:hypothetical protein PDJAM_G00060480 [Pangasius djambal]|uniref:Uncharacterized protein n=1 Tax=Pangasius djambal TaxID=1691987 RepID=A0ACC5Z081_9TELE|nr:hypothetical protein [Pangasius djambal]